MWFYPGYFYGRGLNAYAFNNAWEQYKEPEKRKLGGSREQAAHRVAWSAVEKKYEKSADGSWVEKGSK